MDKDIVTTTPNHRINRTKGIAIEDIVKYADQGLTHLEIAKLVGCDKSNVTRRLQAIDYQGESIRDYKSARANIFASGQRRIVKGITQTDIKNASLLQKVTAVGILQDKEDQVLGKSGSATADSISAMVELVDKVVKAVKDPIPPTIDITPDTSDNES